MGISFSTSGPSLFSWAENKKKIFFSTVFLGCFFMHGGNVFAQNVGVNTDGSAASTLFHTKNTTAATNNYLRIENTQAAQQSALQLLNSGTAGADWIQYIPGSSTDLRFYRGADLVTFLANGNVGIGTTIPSEAISVYKAIGGGWQGRFANSSGSGADVYLSHGSGYGMHIRGWNASDAIYTLEMYNSTALTNAFYNSGRVVLGMVGNVGIGTSSPSKKLQVTGGSQTTTSLLTDGYVEDISGIMNGNYIPSRTWTAGSGSIGIFNENGSGDNVREWGDGPHGNRVLLWKASGASNADDGGWNTNTFNIDNTRTYRVSVWIKRTGSNDGTTYLGIQGSNITYLTGGAEGNPYFWCGDLPVLDRWYLVVGYIHGSGDASTSNKGGIYDGVTGLKVVSYGGGGNCDADFKFTGSATTQQQRAYLYYNSTGATRQYFWDPRFEEVNGKELSISALLGVNSPAPSSDNYIQNQTASDQSAGFRINGNGLFNGGNVGIGLTSPGANLDVSGTGRVQGNFYIGTNFNKYFYQSVDRIIVSAESTTDVAEFASYGLYLPKTNAYNLYIGGGAQFAYGTAGYIDFRNEGGISTNSGTLNMYFKNSGNVGIGTTNPAQKLEVNGKVKSNGINETSDIRFKQNILPISSALDKTLSLNGVNFSWKKEEFPERNFDDKLQMGLIAQEVEKIIPEVVITDGDGYKSVEYSKIVGLLIESIKEQQKTIRQLQSNVSDLENANMLIRNDVDRLKQERELKSMK